MISQLWELLLRLAQMGNQKSFDFGIKPPKHLCQTHCKNHIDAYPSKDSTPARQADYSGAPTATES